MKRAALTLVELLVIVAIIVIAVALLFLSVEPSRTPSRQLACLNNLKQIALALQAYERDHHAFPPAYTTDANGKPLHSWRTLILPYLEEQGLYASIDLTKPWNDPANAKALNTVVAVYQCHAADTDDGLTTYLAVVTPNSCIRATEPRRLSDITDGPQATLMVIEVEAANAVPWMAPSDADENSVLNLGGPKSKSPHPHGTNAAFADGRVEYFNDDMPPAERRALISIAGNEGADGKATE